MFVEPRVLSLLPTGFESSLLWRHWFPSNELKRHDITADWVYLDNFREQVEPLLRCGKYNTIVTPRFIFREAWMLKYFQQLLEQYNLAWVYELDDDLLSPEIVNRQVEYWLQSGSYKEKPEQERKALLQSGLELERISRKNYLKSVDGITVSTEALKNVVEQYTSKPVFVVENAIDPAWFKLRMFNRPRITEALTIGWSGGWRYEQDIRTVIQAWGRIAKRFESVHFVLSGYVPPSVFFEVPADRLHLIDWVPLDEYPSVLQSIDIGCCAVADNHWNECKSAIKWLEFSLAGVPCVCSPTIYDKHVRNESDALLASTVDEWEAQLSRLILDRPLRQSMARNAGLSVTTNANIAYSWPKWMNAWRAILASKSYALA